MGRVRAPREAGAATHRGPTGPDSRVAAAARQYQRVAVHRSPDAGAVGVTQAARRDPPRVNAMERVPGLSDCRGRRRAAVLAPGATTLTAARDRLQATGGVWRA